MIDPGVTTMIRYVVEIELEHESRCVPDDQASGPTKVAIQEAILNVFAGHFSGVHVRAVLEQHTLVDLRR